jgi:hypothetical protein
MASPRGEAGQPEECSIWRSDKTFIGQIERCFDFLANKTIDNFIKKASRLYEQRREMAVLAVSPLEMYVRRWLRWTKSGLEYVRPM